MIRASQMRLAQTPDTAPDAAEVLNIVSVADFKAEHRITSNAENSKIEECIREAYNRLDGKDGKLNRAILTQTWVGLLDEFDDTIEIPLPSPQSITSIEYRDRDGDWQTLATTVYGYETHGLFGRVYLKNDQSWPDLYEDPGSVRITFVCGWGDGAAVLASAYGIRKAIKLLAGHFFSNPTPTFVEPRLVEVPRKIWFGLDFVLGQYRIVNDHS